MFCNVFYALVFWIVTLLAPHHTRHQFDGFGVGNPKLDRTSHEHGSPARTGAKLAGRR